MSLRTLRQAFTTSNTLVTTAPPTQLPVNAVAGNPGSAVVFPGVYRSGEWINISPSGLTPPGESAVWKIFSWSIQFSLFILTFQAEQIAQNPYLTPSTAWGKLGKIIGGPTREAQAQNQAVGMDPTDFSLLETMWDGQTDDCPVIVDVANYNGAPILSETIRYSSVLPQPITMTVFDNLMMALIMTPCILPAWVNLFAYNARFSIDYDDGEN